MLIFPILCNKQQKWKLWSIWIIFLRRQKLVVFLYYLVVVFIVFNCLCLLFTFVFKKMLLLPLEMMIRHIICILSGWKKSSVPFSAHLLKRWWGNIGLKTVSGLWLIPLLFKEARFCKNLFHFLQHHHLYLSSSFVSQICSCSFLQRYDLSSY